MNNIDSRKSALLNEFMQLSSGVSSDDILPLLLAFSNKARQEHISFTKSDIETLFESMKKRMPWLIVLLGLGMVVSSVVGMFEKVVTCLPIIMCFQSLILDMAGNVGTQSLAVTIRVLMDESLTGKQKAELVFKEMRIGLCNGGLLGLMSFVLIGLYIFAIKGKTLAFSYAVSACIGVALLLAMLISSAVGTCIPLLFKKIKVDPAVASGPLITTINDLVAVVSYYGLSWLFLIEFFHMAG